MPRTASTLNTQPNPRTTGLKSLTTWLCLLCILLPLTAPAAETITYYHNDAQGSPLAATDETGNLLWRETYRPYGERINKDPNSTPNTRYYTGHPHDDTTGLTYAGARYYDPVIGRFLAIDPQPFQEGLIHSFNRYSYGNNNPYKYIDPDGENAVTFFGGALYETGQFLTGNGFNGPMVMGALADGYNGEGGGFSEALIQDATTFIPAGIVAGTLIKVNRLVGAGKGVEKSLGNNPFKGKTPEQIDDMFKRKGYDPKGPNPLQGQGTYVNPKTGRGYHIDANHPPPKGPHVGVHRPRGSIREKLDPRDYKLE